MLASSLPVALSDSRHRPVMVQACDALWSVVGRQRPGLQTAACAGSIQYALCQPSLIRMLDNAVDLWMKTIVEYESRQIRELPQLQQP